MRGLCLTSITGKCVTNVFQRTCLDIVVLVRTLYNVDVPFLLLSHAAHQHCLAVLLRRKWSTCASRSSRSSRHSVPGPDRRIPGRRGQVSPTSTAVPLRRPSPPRRRRPSRRRLGRRGRADAPGPFDAPAERPPPPKRPDPVTGGTTFDLFSHYVWRGFVITDSFSFQPVVWAKVGDLTVSSWSSWAEARVAARSWSTTSPSTHQGRRQDDPLGGLHRLPLPGRGRGQRQQRLYFVSASPRRSIPP